MLASTLLVTPNPTLLLLHKPHFNAVYFRPFSKSHVCFAFPPSNQEPIGEEARWLREEQRWLREEQRWLREESRWNAERQALLQEINSLRLRIHELEPLQGQGASVSETFTNIAKLLQALKEGDLGKNVNIIAESGSSASPLVVEAATKEIEEVVVKQVVDIPEKKETVKKKVTLRIGSEGVGVQAMQEALQKLGFYSGEEDMEFSSFSTGTERAVKTWQATLGAREDGIMTADLLQRLYGGSDTGLTKTEEHKPSKQEKGSNGAPVNSNSRSVNDVQQTAVTDERLIGSRPRVFLLGENRWEEPSRLSGGSQKTAKNGSTVQISTNKCITCRGEGRLLCMECDGTGEPNIEPQFIEWVDEGEAKCPYCEGLGFITCDLCEGKEQ